jgi:SAM-dependent methyltransferase
MAAVQQTLELAQCPACGATRFEAVTLAGGATLRRCLGCDTVSAPEYADPAEVYVDGYLYGGTEFGLDVRNPRFQGYLLAVAHRRMAAIERASGRKGTLLDVGCGTGEVMLAARERGWGTQGVEPLEDASALARDQRGLDVRTATLEESGLPERGYDVVSAFHVLEHMPDTRGFLRTLARWARPGGHVVVEVPNFDSAIRRYHGSNWSGLRPLEHLVHFTAATLEGAFRRAGLEPVDVATPSYVGPPQSFDNAIADLAKFRWKRALAPLAPVRQIDGHAVRVPGRLGWRVLHAIEAIAAARRHGQVVLGIARAG